MIYRRTDNVLRRLAQRHEAIVAAARTLAAEGGMGAVQIAAVAERAGIAAGTVYRYVASKAELVSILVAAVSDREISALRRAADAAPGPLSALAAALTTFAARSLAHRRLAWALIAEPVDPEIDALRLTYRRALVAEIETRVKAAIVRGQLPDQDAALAAAALLGALLEGLIGPLAFDVADDRVKARGAVQSATLLALRAVGVVDAHARGLVVQTALPIGEDAA